LQKYQDKAKQYIRKNQPVKPIFVGSPVRPPAEGGVMTHKCKTRYDSPEDEPKKETKAKKPDIHSTKGSIDLYAFINDVGINRIRDRVDASNSILLTKA
jgi:hypothetical protein